MALQSQNLKFRYEAASLHSFNLLTGSLAPGLGTPTISAFYFEIILDIRKSHSTERSQILFTQLSLVLMSYVATVIETRKLTVVCTVNQSADLTQILPFSPLLVFFSGSASSPGSHMALLPPFYDVVSQFSFVFCDLDPFEACWPVILCSFSIGFSGIFSFFQVGIVCLG